MQKCFAEPTLPRALAPSIHRKEGRSWALSKERSMILTSMVRKIPLLFSSLCSLRDGCRLSLFFVLLILMDIIQFSVASKRVFAARKCSQNSRRGARAFSGYPSPPSSSTQRPRPWAKKKPLPAPPQGDLNGAPNLSLIREQTLTRYHQIIKLDPTSANLPPDEYFVNLLGILATFEKAYQLHFGPLPRYALDFRQC